MSFNPDSVDNGMIETVGERTRRESAESAREAAHRSAFDDFLLDARRMDATATASAGRMITDWFTGPIETVSIKRKMTVAEMMEDACDYREGPQISDVMQVLLDVAFGSDLASMPAKARKLILDMAGKWADQNAEVADE